MPFEKPEPRKAKKLTPEQEEEIKDLSPQEKTKKRMEWDAYDDGIYIEDIVVKDDF